VVFILAKVNFGFPAKFQITSIEEQCWKLERVVEHGGSREVEADSRVVLNCG